MEEMEVTENSVSGVPLRKHRLSEKSFDRIILFLVCTIIVLSFYACLITYQQSRYVAYDYSYHPQWDGIRWVRNPNSFNCLDYTSEMIRFLGYFGITSYQVVGTNKESGEGHSWVGIDCFGYIINFEPQYLFIFDPSWEYKNVYVNKP